MKIPFIVHDASDNSTQVKATLADGSTVDATIKTRRVELVSPTPGIGSQVLHFSGLAYDDAVLTFVTGATIECDFPTPTAAPVPTEA